ncbi:MAG: hypothetical protein ACLRXQ_09485 [Phascolarctobacterium faecium]
MARFAVKTLEFDKVKALLASKTATSLGKAQALAIRTESEFSIVKRLQEETAGTRCWMKGKIPWRRA